MKEAAEIHDFTACVYGFGQRQTYLVQGEGRKTATTIKQSMFDSFLWKRKTKKKLHPGSEYTGPNANPSMEICESIVSASLCAKRKTKVNGI